MNKTEIQLIVEGAERDTLINALKTLFEPHTTPVFGAVKVIEHEIAALKALRLLGFLDHNSGEYRLVEKLRVTKPKARSLLYQEALRKTQTQADYDAELKLVISSARVQREDKTGMFLIEVPQPLIMDMFRSRIRRLGYLSDGTFSAGVARIPERALLALIEDLIPEDQREAVNEHLQEFGLPDTSIKSFMREAFVQFGSRVAGEAGGEIAGTWGGMISDWLSGAFNPEQIGME